MLFSVIVPFLNEEKYIRRCLEALVDQDFGKNEYEIIFVDNGSADGSSAIVSQFSGVRLLREEARGAYKARNRALAEAKGEIIAFTDADCVVVKDWLRQIENGMKDTGASIAMGPVYFPNDNSKALKLFEDYQNAKAEYVMNKSLKKFYYGYTNNMAFKADIFKKLGLFSEGVGSGDTEMVHRCMAKYPGCKVAYLEDVKVEHLEVSGLGVYQKKMYGYGRDSILVNKACGYASLGLKERLEVYRYCCDKHSYSVSDRALSLIVLLMVFFSFECGRLMRKMGM
ncbi:MAG: glycosyltransferase [Candidatus Omnitrophica bacterium]|nr:glycosyltransferase [Candidatus Omnitrophota bacterium]